MCSTACILDDIFIVSRCFRHHFAEKWTLLSELTSHKYVRLTLPTRYVVFTCRHNVVLLKSPALNCMLCFAALKRFGRSEIEGRRCCPPQRAFNKPRTNTPRKTGFDGCKVCDFPLPRCVGSVGSVGSVGYVGYVGYIGYVGYVGYIGLCRGASFRRRPSPRSTGSPGLLDARLFGYRRNPT